jgi:WD40 repeat protein
MLNQNTASIPSKHGKRLALIVGVDTAPRSTLQPLQCACNDATAIAHALQEYGDFELAAPPLLNEDATSGDVRKAILDLIKDRTNHVDRHEDDFLLFYFSGHGYQRTIDNEMLGAYIVTSDFDPGHVEDDDASHLSMCWLRDMLFTKTKAGRVLIVLDCCYAGDVLSSHNLLYLEQLQRHIRRYFEVSSREADLPPGVMRAALAASRYDQPAFESHGHGEMTWLLLNALNGTQENLLNDDGQVTLYRLCEYLQKETPSYQNTVVLMSESTSKTCVLASHNELIGKLRRKRSRNVPKQRPDSYIGIARDSTFQERPHEFEELEKLLFPTRSDMPPRIGLVSVGVIGMGGQGKTRLALEVAYRYESRFPDGVYCMTATGTDRDEWVEHFAELAINTGYLPLEDDGTLEKGNLRNRARHMCIYLVNHADALLILDNVEEPNLINSMLTELGGQEARCAILYTSRNSFVPSIQGVVLHRVGKLPEVSALALLLEKRSLPVQSANDMLAARNICSYVDYLPLALVLLQNLLQDQYETLPKLEQKLKSYGVLETTRIDQYKRSPLFTVFKLSWDKVQSEDARRILKLASYFPEAASIPIWLLGLVAGLGEHSAELACRQLRKWSLIEAQSEILICLHPIIREFAQFLIEDHHDSQTLLPEVRERLLSEFTDLNRLEERARRVGYWQCLDMVHAASPLARSLQIGQELELVERWMAREGLLLGQEQLWPNIVPGLFYQQLYNRALESGRLIMEGVTPTRWLRQENRVGAEDPHLLQSIAGHEGDINCVVFSYDGKQVVTGASDWKGTVRVWDATDGRLLYTSGKHDGAVISIVLLPGMNNVVICTVTGMVYTLSLQDHSETVLLPAEDHAGARVALAVSTSGSRMLACASGKVVAIRSVETGKTVATFPGHERDITSIAFSPDGSQLATGSSDRFVCLWDVGSRQLIMQLPEHDQGVTSIAFSPDGRSIITGSEDSAVRIWNAADGQCATVLKGHDKPITSVLFSPDGTEVVAGSTDGVVLLWDIARERVIKRLHGHTDRLISIAFSPDGTKLATGARDRTAHIWNLANDSIANIEIEPCCEITNVAFSSDGGKAVVASNNDTVHLWDVAKGEVLSSLSDGLVLTKRVAFSPDSVSVATGSSQGTVCIWDSNKRSVEMILSGHAGDITSLMFSPDGKTLATASMDTTVRLWTISTGREKALLKGHSSEVTSIAFSFDGKQIITGSKDGAARIWDMADQSTLRLLKDRFRDVTSVSFSHDGTKVATGSSGGTVRIWQHGNNTPLIRLKKHSSEITSLCFSPDDSLLIAGDRDGWVCIWSINERQSDQLIGIYRSVYGIGAIHWQNARKLTLADVGGPQHRPFFYRLALEGNW